MRRVMFALALSALTLTASADASADDYKIIKLEQDMRNLERQVQTLQREVNDLRMRLSRAGDRSTPSRADGAQAPASGDWLLAANWDRIRTGMNELDVIGVLGPPTSMRADNDARVLLYAMELGANSFLSGSVTLREHAVIDVQRPVLR